MRFAAAPISWGVCEVPGWGHQLAAGRVVREARELGFSAIEAGPEGFFEGPVDGLRIVAAFVAADDLAPLERQAAWLQAVGGEVLVMAAASGRPGYDTHDEPDPQTWRAIAAAQESASAHGLRFAVHPHFGTLVETAEQLELLLHVTTAGLCLDTGHLLLGGVDPLEVAKRHPGRISHVHLKDVDVRLAADVRDRRLGYRDAVSSGLYRPLGEGGAAIAAVLEALKAAHYDGWCVLEQDLVLASEPAPGGGPKGGVRRSLEFLRRLGLSPVCT